MEYEVKQFEGTIQDEVSFRLEHQGSIIDIEFFHDKFIITYFAEKDTTYSHEFILTSECKDIKRGWNFVPFIRIRRFYAGKMYYLIELE